MFCLLLVDPKISCYYSTKPAVVSESLAPSSMHVTNPQDTADSDPASYFLPFDFDLSQVLPTQVYRETELSKSQVPFQYGLDLDFNNQPENSLAYDPPSSSTGSLSMDCDVDPYQLQQSLDPNTQYFIDSFIPQPMSPYVSNTSPGNSHSDFYAEITGSSESHFMTSANDGTSSPFPNYDANNPHNYM